MPVYFTNPVMAQQRMADDQLPMQQEALRLQELAQLLQASQQNQRTRSDERQNSERVGAQRYQTETWGGVSRDQNENVRRRGDAATLQAINDLALRRDQMIKEVELEKGRQLTAKEIAIIQSQASRMRPQDAAENERQNLEIERTNRNAAGLATQINDAASLLEENDLKPEALKALAKGYQDQDGWDWGGPNDDKIEIAKNEVSKRKAKGVYARAAIAGLGLRPDDALSMLDISGGVAKPIVSQKLSMGAAYGGGGKGNGLDIARLLGMVGGRLSEAELSQGMAPPSFGYGDAAQTPAVWRPGMDDGLFRDSRPATVNVDQYGRPIQGTNSLDAIKLLMNSGQTNRPNYRGFKMDIPGGSSGEW